MPSEIGMPNSSQVAWRGAELTGNKNFAVAVSSYGAATQSKLSNPAVTGAPEKMLRSPPAVAQLPQARPLSSFHRRQPSAAPASTACNPINGYRNTRATSDQLAHRPQAGGEAGAEVEGPPCARSATSPTRALRRGAATFLRAWKITPIPSAASCRRAAVSPRPACEVHQTRHLARDRRQHHRAGGVVHPVDDASRGHAAAI